MADPYDMLADWDLERDRLIDEMADRRVRQAAAAERPWCERGLTVSSMSQPEYSAWCDAGRPPLTREVEAPHAVAPPRVISTDDAVVSKAVRQHVRKRAQEVIDLVGEEVGRFGKELHSDLIRRLDLVQSGLQLSVQELRAAIGRLEQQQAAHEADIAALRQELAEARQAEAGPRRRSTALRGNSHAAPPQRQ